MSEPTGPRPDFRSAMANVLGREDEALAMHFAGATRVPTAERFTDDDGGALVYFRRRFHEISA